MSEKIIQSINFKEILGENDWYLSNNLSEFIRELHGKIKQLNPLFEIHLEAIHRCDDDDTDDDTDGTQEVYGKLIFLTDSSYVIHDNPWKGKNYYASLAQYDSRNKGWIVPKSSIGTGGLFSQEYLFVEIDEIKAIEVHLPYARNKEVSSIVLERVDE